ncbi:MlaD family protein [Caenispirillum bisanense]|uniref:MlaD family protein n=1 Tax=Caenispirillum bisanense TaxID=414052 RepID=UPI0031DA679D
MFSRSKETLFGLVTVAVVGALLAYNFVQRHERRAENGGGITLIAQFNRTDGLREGAAVRMAGVPVGVVADMRLTDRYKAEVLLGVRRDLELPDDSAAIIETDGLFGNKYIELQPGGSDDMLGDGDRIAYTQDAVILEELLTAVVARAKAARAAAEAGGHGGGGGTPAGDIMTPAAPAAEGENGDADADAGGGGPAGTAAPPGASPFPSLTD